MKVDLVAGVQGRITAVRRYRQAVKILWWVVAAIVFVAGAVWFMAGHLAELLLYPWAHSLHGHWLLYYTAVWESIPKVSLGLTIALVGLALLGGRLETILINPRTTNINKEPNMKTIRHLPRYALALGALVVAATGVAGYTHAQGEQNRLAILRQETDAKGHQTVTTNLSFRECTSQNRTDLTGKYDVKRGLNLSADDVVQVIAASCNLAKTESFITDHYHLSSQRPAAGEIMEAYYGSGMAVRVKALTASTITYEYIRGGQLQTSDGVAMNPQSKVYRDGVEQPLDQLKVGDIVVPVTHSVTTLAPARGGGLSGTGAHSEVAAFVVLPATPEFKWYDTVLQGGVTRISTCAGNTVDECLGTGGMDLYLGDVGAERGAYKQIQGRITAINGAAVTLQSSSGRSFTVTFPRNTIASFNAQHANNKIGAGDALDISYHEPESEHSLTIEAAQIQMASLQLEVLRKEDAPHNY